MKIDNYDFEAGFLDGCVPIDIDEGNRGKLLKLKEFKHKWKENNKIGWTVHYWLLK